MPAPVPSVPKAISAAIPLFRQWVNRAWGEQPFQLPSIDWAITERFNMINAILPIAAR